MSSLSAHSVAPPVRVRGGVGVRRTVWLFATCALAFPAAPLPAAAPPINRFVHISDDQGLAHSDVRAIAQDHDGFIWLGLRLGGLTRYDGYELKVHRHDPQNPRSIGNQVIWSLLVDRSDTLWIGTEGGLDRYDRATDSFIHYRHDPDRADSLANNVVTSIFEDSRGRIWAATRKGLCRLEDRERGTFTTFTRPQLVEGSTVKDTFRSVVEDPTTGLLWLGSTDGLAAFDPRTGAFASFLHDEKDPESLGINAVNKVFRDPGGVFWAFTERGVDSFVPTFDRVETTTVQQPRLAFRHFVQPAEGDTPGINFVRDGIVDRTGRMWLATRGGLQLFDRATGVFTAYRRRPSDPGSLSDDLTQAVFEDRAGNIWVGTYAGGANLLRGEAKPFHVHRHHPEDTHSLSDDRIVGLAFDVAGRLWAATVRGLNRYDGPGWTRFLHDPDDEGSLPNNDLSTVATAPNGDVWVGTNYGGPYRYDQRRFHSFPTFPSNTPAPNGWQTATGQFVNSILADEKGGVWLGARVYGLDYYVDGRFLHHSPQEALGDQLAQPTQNPLLGILAEDGALWFATETSGLVRFDPGTQRFKAFQPPRDGGFSTSTPNLLCVVSGADGVIWLGAADGLLKFDTKTERFLARYSTVHGLPHASVVAIVPDRRGRLWLGTANGLAEFDPATEKIRVYEKPDGLPTNVFSQRTGALGSDGRVYFGTRAGMVAFMPEELRDNPNPPPVVLTELRWLGAAPGLRNGGGEIISFARDEAIRVPAGQPGFSLKFSALDFTAPEKNRFRYRLEGWDADWRTSTARERSATYTALPPGDYTFRVQASNPDGVWNERGVSAPIVVERRFWQTLWFRVGLALSVIGAVAAGIQWRLRNVRRRNALLEQQVFQRTAQLRQEVLVRQQAEAALRESHTDLEQRVRARTAELAQSNVNLQAEVAERKSVEAQLRQSQKMEAVGQLAGGVAHDFNNLLTVILGQSELLSDTSMPPETRAAAVRDINAAAQRATNLTRQLLVFSRHQAVSPVAVDLNRVVVEVGKLLRHLIGEHIALETHLSPRALGVLADPGMLEQVLLNMAVNARDVMPRGGRLAISTQHVVVAPERARQMPHASPGEFAVLSVSDTGTGIPDNILPQIFEPFFTTKESGKGTGLGLAISLGIVQQHRGWINVETSAGKGTTFHVYLPSHALPASAPVAGRRSPLQSTDNTTILVVEDEAAVRGVVKHVLARQGYRVIEASSGSDALAQWAVHKDEVAVLLTDIVMPGGLDGHELAGRLLEEKPGLRVITMSGYDPGEFAGRDGHARPHVRKPFTSDDLLRAIDGTRRKNGTG